MHIVIAVLLLAFFGFYYYSRNDNTGSAVDRHRVIDELDLDLFNPEKIDSKNAQYAIALIAGYPDLSIERIIKVLNKRWGQLGEFKDLGATGNIRKIGFENIVFEFELQGRIKNRNDLRLLDFDPDRLPQQRHPVEHYDATVVLGIREVQDSLAAVTFLRLIVCALTESCPQVAGVWVVAANHFLSRKHVLKKMAYKELDIIPVDSCVSTNTFASETGKISGYTCGLRAFGLDEFEVINGPESEADLRNRLAGLANYSVVNCKKILNGDTTGYDENERIRMKKEPSKTVHKGWVFRLYY